MDFFTVGHPMDFFTVGHPTSQPSELWFHGQLIQAHIVVVTRAFSNDRLQDSQ